MEFCDRCGGSMLPKKAGKRTILICRKCGKKRTVSTTKGFKIAVAMEKKSENIIVLDKKSMIDTLPKTNTPCPKCENTEAYWWMRQTRAADEAATRFYRCVKCGHVWREYE